jgi:hypothetical protein
VARPHLRAPLRHPVDRSVLRATAATRRQTGRPAARCAVHRARSRRGPPARPAVPAGKPPAVRPAGATGAARRLRSCAAPRPNSAPIRPVRHASAPAPYGADAATDRTTPSCPLPSCGEPALPSGRAEPGRQCVTFGARTATYRLHTLRTVRRRSDTSDCLERQPMAPTSHSSALASRESPCGPRCFVSPV